MTEKVHVLNPLSDRPAFKPAQTDLERRARQIGTLAGRIAALVQQVQERLDEQSWNDLRSSAERRTQELRQAAAQRVQECRQLVESRYQRARDRAREAAHDYPIHIALAAGVAGFVVGAALRVGRVHRAQ